MFATSEENHDSTEEINMPVFSEESSVVSQQPMLDRELERGPRRFMPLATIEGQNATSTSQFSSMHGLDFLLETNQLIIQQTVELTDLMSNLASENRYTVKVPRAETIYYATETSQTFQRNCFGSGRAFSMRLYDPTQQEVIQLKRRLACGSCCSFFCYLQVMEVWVSPGELIGRVEQNFNATKPDFSVYNKHGQIIYRIEGPQAFLGCLMSKNYNFQIYSGDGSTQVGSVIHQWDQVQTNYNLYLQYPGNEQNAHHKALLLGAAFLLEYMYFESSRRKGSIRCIC